MDVPLQEYTDPCVSEAKDLLKSSNWSSRRPERLNFKQNLGYHKCHRAGFGSISIPEIPPKHSFAYRKLLTSIMEEAEEEKYQAIAVQLSVQGQWTKWCSYVRMNLSWKTLLAMLQQLLTFCLGVTYDNTLPSPSNLHPSHINPEASCLLCRKQVCTTAHVLGACTVALQQGCFTFHHDSVLSILAVAPESFLSSKKCVNAQSNIHQIY